MKLRRGFLIAAVLILTGASAEAKPWTVDYSQSKLGFSGLQSDNVFQGSFKKFTTTIDFDLDHPETSNISATIDIASIGTGDGERDGMLPQSDWFNTSKFPQATFVSTAIHTVPGGSTTVRGYEADGMLTIKGMSKPVALPFTLSQEGDHWRAQGKITLDRTDYKIGQGQWESDGTVKFPVDVMVDIVAKPAS
jgi:polyisoprenoid-binding protein YceI